MPRPATRSRTCKAGMRFFVEFCTEDPARYQLLFQRTIPGFEPSPESFAISVDGLRARARAARRARRRPTRRRSTC